MRMLTVIRQVLDAEETVSIQDGTVALDGRKLVLDTMDEYGVEEALRLREAGAAGAEVVALAIGPARIEEALRSALAMGADRAILVETDAPLDVIAVSSVVAQVARSEQVDLIFCGGQQADWEVTRWVRPPPSGWNGRRQPGPVLSSCRMASSPENTM